MVQVTLILAAAAFVVGTATYFVSGIVGQVALDLGVSVGAAGQLTSAFAIAYAVTAPLLVSATVLFERRRLICMALLAFAAANLMAALAPGFGTLIASRILAALSATMITPVAVATAAQLAPIHRRGLVMATVMGGITVAFAIGVPLGTYFTAATDWRTVFFALAGMSVAAAIAVRVVLPVVHAVPTGTPSLAVMRDPAVAVLLGMTVLMFAAAFTVFGFIGPILTSVAGANTAQVSMLLLVFGATALVGTVAGGWLSDRIGSGRSVTAMLVLFALAHLGFSAFGLISDPALRLIAVTLVMALAALPGFAFMPIQQARLAARAGPDTPMAIAWHASAIFVGQGLGAVIGGLVAASGTMAFHGLVSAFIALALIALSMTVNRIWFAAER